MNNYEKIYWLTRLDSLHSFLTGLIIICGIVAACSIIFYPLIELELHDITEDEVRVKKVRKSIGRFRIASLIVMPIAALILAFTPTKNEMIVIYAGGATMDYIGKDTSLSKIPYQTTAIISEYLDKEIKELKGGKK